MSDKVKVMKIDTDPAQSSVRELREELKRLKDVMLSAEQGTEEYNNALKQAADIQHTLKEQMQEINATAMDFGQITSNCTQALGGMVAGFQAATAVMNLFGTENEDVIKTLKTMQQLMSITQALPAIDNGVKAFKRLAIAIKASSTAMKGLSKAVIASGLGAIVAALGLLITNWDKVSDAMKRWGIIHETTTERLQKEKEKVEELKGKLEEAKQAYEDWEKKQKENNLSDEAKKEYEELTRSIEGYNLKLNQIVAEQATANRSRWEELQKEGLAIDQLINQAKKRQRQILDDAEATKTAAKAREEADKRAEEAAKKAREEAEELKKSYQELIVEIADWSKSEKELALDKITKEETKRIEIIRKSVKDAAEAEKQISAIREHYAKERAETEKKYADEATAKEIKDSIEAIDTAHQLSQAKLQQQYDEKLMSEKEFNDRKKELLTNYVNDYITNIQFILDTEKDLTDAQILDLTNKINEARELLKSDTTTIQSSVLASGITEAINASALALNEFSDNPAWGKILQNVAILTTNWETLHKQMQEGGKKAFTAYAQIAATALSAVATMMNGLAAEQDTTNKEGFESAKKFQIAGATMSMLAGIASAWASSMQLMFPANVIVGSILSTLMTGLGIAQIIKIKNTKFGGSDTGNSSSATPSTSAINAIQAPVQYTQDVQGANIEGAIKDSKVYVTETDISSTQKKVEVSETEARY